MLLLLPMLLPVLLQSMLLLMLPRHVGYRRPCLSVWVWGLGWGMSRGVCVCV